MEYLVICLASLAVSGLTLFSGFGLGKEAFIATGVVLACVVDVTRLGVYAGMSGSHMITDNAGLVITLTAFLGVHYSRKVLKKITIQTLRVLVGMLLLPLGGGLASGLIRGRMVSQALMWRDQCLKIKWSENGLVLRLQKKAGRSEASDRPVLFQPRRITR
ncbi:MAG: hypothetical protein Q7J24_11970 [Desulfomicrobium sp.]|nr:hypothetical protein [Desulfomicrobium sp.]